ncbi:L-Aspartase-like protein [Trichoderma barbatum]
MASDSKPSGAMLWGGLDPLMVKYNESIYFDRFLYKHWEFEKLEQGLREFEKEWEAGTFTIVPGVDDDVFTVNGRRLGDIIGKNIAGKLQTGRNRNEQLVCDMRMWLRDELREIEQHLINILNVIATQYPPPTSIPIRWSHWMLSYGFGFGSDLERLREVIKRVNRSTLGCGALTGNPFGIDCVMITKELGFDGLIWNSMAGVSDRDFAEDLIIYSTAEFEFVRLSDAYSTGSSLMPQIPKFSSYCEARIVNGVLATLNEPSMLATDVADYLVRKGVPFRETPHISGRCVAKSEETGIPMNELSFEQLKAIDSRFEEDIAEAFVYETSVERRSAKGGTSKFSVLEQIQVIKAVLNESQL